MKRAKHRHPTTPGEYWIHRAIKGGPVPAGAAGRHVWVVQWMTAGAVTIHAADVVLMQGLHETVYHPDGAQPHGYIKGIGRVTMHGKTATCDSDMF